MSIKLNCDMGESFGIWKMGLDEQIMPLVDMANLACGFHASDALTMKKSVQEAKKSGISIGAHPGYQDLVGFGRRSMLCSFEEIEAIILYQLGALIAICKTEGAEVSYVKPHGAMYNDMMKDENIFKAILKAISSYDKNIKLMILSSGKNEEYSKIANEYKVGLLFEVFADRNYTDEGFLVARSKENAVLSNEDEVIKRVSKLKESGYLLSESGKKLFLQTDTICVHGDNEKALDFVRRLKEIL